MARLLTWRSEDFYLGLTLTKLDKSRTVIKSFPGTRRNIEPKSPPGDTNGSLQGLGLLKASCEEGRGLESLFYLRWLKLGLEWTKQLLTNSSREEVSIAEKVSALFPHLMFFLYVMVRYVDLGHEHPAFFSWPFLQDNLSHVNLMLKITLGLVHLRHVVPPC